MVIILAGLQSCRRFGCDWRQRAKGADFGQRSERQDGKGRCKFHGGREMFRQRLSGQEMISVEYSLIGQLLVFPAIVVSFRSVLNEVM